MAITGEGNLKITGLLKVIIDRYNSGEGPLMSLVNKRTSKKSEEKWTGAVGVGLPEVKAKGDMMTTKDLFIETPKQILMETIALACQIPFEDQEDDQYDAITTLFDQIGDGHLKYRELMVANLFNAGFLTVYRTGYDGLPLFSTAHTLTNANTYSPGNTDLTALPTRTATTWANTLSTQADFDYIPYSDLCVTLARTPDRQGDYMGLEPAWILFPPELRTAVNEVIGSDTRPDTTNRAVSGIYRNVRKVQSALVLDSDSWFIGSDRNDLQFFDRMPLRVKKRDVEGSWDVRVETVSRAGIGLHCPRGVAGCKGA